MPSCTCWCHFQSKLEVLSELYLLGHGFYFHFILLLRTLMMALVPDAFIGSVSARRRRRRRRRCRRRPMQIRRPQQPGGRLQLLVGVLTSATFLSTQLQQCNVSLMGRSSGVMRVIIKQLTQLSFSKDQFAIEPNADLLRQFLLVIFSENLNTTELQVDTNANKIPRGPHIAAYEKIMFKKPQIDCCYDYAWEAIAKIRISVS